MITIDEHTPVEILRLSLSIDTIKGNLILDQHEGMVWRQEGREDRYIPWPVFFALADGCDISHREGLSHSVHHPHHRTYYAKERIVERAQEADINPSVTDL